MALTRFGSVNPESRADNGISDSAVSESQPDGGAANTVKPRTDMDSEQAESDGGDTTGAGANTDVGVTSTSTGAAQGPSNVNTAYPGTNHPISGTPLPTSEGKGNVSKGWKGSSYSKG